VLFLFFVFFFGFFLLSIISINISNSLLQKFFLFYLQQYDQQFSSKNGIDVAWLV